MHFQVVLKQTLKMQAFKGEANIDELTKGGIYQACCEELQA